MSHTTWSIVSYTMAHWQKAFWPTFIFYKWAPLSVWLDANLEISTKKALSSTMETIYASIETSGIIEY
jgi:hypothetical protein